MTNEDIEVYELFERIYHYESGHALMHVLKKIPFKYVQAGYIEIDRYFRERDGELVPIAEDEGWPESFRDEIIRDYMSREKVITKREEIFKATVEPLEDSRTPVMVFFIDGQDPEDPKYQKQFRYAEHELMTFLAGPIAEMIYVDKEKIDPNSTNMYEFMSRYGGVHDYLNGHKSAHMVYFRIECEDYDRWLSWLAYRVERILRQPLYRVMIEAIVDILRDENTLTYKEVAAICKTVEKEQKKSQSLVLEQA